MTTQTQLDTVVRAQTIYSLAPDRTVQRALAIRGGRVLAASPDPTAFDGDVARGTSVLDVRSLTILPAFFDNHNHLGEASRNNLFVAVGKATSIAEMVELIRRRAAQTPPGEWIQTSNDWHEDRFVEHRLPTAADLDAATTSHPVVARRGGHLAVVNSEALRISGITRDTPDPPGGSLGHTSSGDPDGVLVGGAQYALLRIPAPALDEQLEQLRIRSEAFAALGLGGVRDPLVSGEDMQLYRMALEHGGLPLRVRAMPLMSPDGSVAERLRRLDALDEWRNFGDDRIRTWGLKFVMDGGPESGALDAPYANNAAFSGQLNWDPSEMEQVVGAAVARGWRVGAHAIGDRAVRVLLDVYEHVLTGNPATPPGRLAIEHAFLANAEQRARAIRLGVAVTVQHPLLYALADSLDHFWGPARTREIMPVRAWLDEGGDLSAGSDYPIGSCAPLETVWGMVTRQTAARGVQGLEQSVDRETAMRLAISGTARLLDESDRCGTLEPGKYADLVAFDADPMTCPIDELRTLRPVFTIVGGRVVTRPSGESPDQIATRALCSRSSRVWPNFSRSFYFRGTERRVLRRWRGRPPAIGTRRQTRVPTPGSLEMSERTTHHLRPLAHRTQAQAAGKLPVRHESPAIVTYLQLDLVRGVVKPEFQ
jgi:predicted amidohydrolase YtcJ